MSVWAALAGSLAALGCQTVLGIGERVQHHDAPPPDAPPPDGSRADVTSTSDAPGATGAEALPDTRVMESTTAADTSPGAQARVDVDVDVGSQNPTEMDVRTPQAPEAPETPQAQVGQDALVGDGDVVDADGDAAEVLWTLDAFAVRDGDLVVLAPSSIQTLPSGAVSAWRDIRPGSQRVAMPANTPPISVQLGGLPCVEFFGGDHLQLDAEAELALGNDDFSLLALLKPSAILAAGDFGRVAVAKALPTDPKSADGRWYSYRGVALLSEWQDIERIRPGQRRFAARLDADYITQQTVELLEPTALPSDAPEEVHAVAVQRREGQLYLHVDARLFGPSPGHVSQPAQAPLLLGKVDGDMDLATTAYRGTLCAVVLHRGQESTDEVRSRLVAMRRALGR